VIALVQKERSPFNDVGASNGPWLKNSQPEEAMMNLYTQRHQFYCGIDLHSKTMHACVVDQAGKKLLHRNFENDDPEFWLRRIEPFRQQDLVVGCESTFNEEGTYDLTSEAI
jgi:hypothetical protein